MKDNFGHSWGEFLSTDSITSVDYLDIGIRQGGVDIEIEGFSNRSSFFNSVKDSDALDAFGDNLLRSSVENGR